ncbi:dynamin family protein [Nonomuraea ferruginea]
MWRRCGSGSTCRAPAEARKASGELLAQLEDYVLPRVRMNTAPALIVVAGSTGAGKSTLVNSLAEKNVSRTGVRRPTTGVPVLVCHPDDRQWFAEGELLGGLRRFDQARPEAGQRGIVISATEKLPQGVALLDTPDIDSVAEEHHEIAHRMLDAADLWIFVTTAARYADAPRLEPAPPGQGARRQAGHRALPRPGQGPRGGAQALRPDAHRVRPGRDRPVRHQRVEGRRRSAARQRGDRGAAVARRAVRRRGPPRPGGQGDAQRRARQLPHPRAGAGQAPGGAGRLPR